MDWAYAEAGIKYSFTMEMRDQGFVVPPEGIEGNGQDMVAFHVSAARDIIQEFGN